MICGGMMFDARLIEGGADANGIVFETFLIETGKIRTGCVRMPPKKATIATRAHSGSVQDHTELKSISISLYYSTKFSLYIIGMTKKDLNLYQCNPKTLQTTRSTCLPHDMLIHLRDSWNTRFPNHAIPHSIRKKDELWAEIRIRLNNQYACSSEYCALQKLGNEKEISAGQAYFRPPKPESWKKNPREWHSSTSLSRVMEQYEDAFDHFEFIGPVPIDFDSALKDNWGKCVVDELCQLNIQELRKKGTRSIGVIFNLDPHDKPGSHWVCAYVDILGGKAYYYDSYGYEPCSEIKRFLRRCKDQGCSEIVWNDIRHQRKQTECGTYCMYIILSLLSGKSFVSLCKDKIDDDTIAAFRDVLYASEKPSSNITTIDKAISLLHL
jgi:hypothetical protein